MSLIREAKKEAGTFSDQCITRYAETAHQATTDLNLPGRQVPLGNSRTRHRKKSWNIMLLVLVFLSITGSSTACYDKTGQTNDSTEINAFIDQWHLAAAKADSVAYFESMAGNSIYIGTDASERWSKTQFMTFARPFFKRGKAWDFKPYDRDLHISSDGQYVWFSELLTTRMGVCRGSGIISLTPGGWKIEQYHLSATVPNILMDDFIRMINEHEKKKR
jgi:hypothetical protein